jgi:hypothetical protein
MPSLPPPASASAVFPSAFPRRLAEFAASGIDFRAVFLPLILAMMIQAAALTPPPKILLIAREPLNPGAQTEYDRIESETARLAAKFRCPHPYLALLPLSGSQDEVWWFNGFSSQDQVNSVGEAYKSNEAWNAALTNNQKRKEPLTGKGTEQFADLLSHPHGQPWALGRTRYVVLAINPAAHLPGGSAFQGRDGKRYEILMMDTQDEAQRVARGKDFVVLEVVPRWSYPAKDWIAANPALWKTR